MVPPTNRSNREKHTRSFERVCSVILASHLTHTAFKSKQYLRGLKSKRCMSSTNGPKFHESLSYTKQLVPTPDIITRFGRRVPRILHQSMQEFSLVLFLELSSQLLVSRATGEQILTLGPKTCSLFALFTI